MIRAGVSPLQGCFAVLSASIAGRIQVMSSVLITHSYFLHFGSEGIPGHDALSSAGNTVRGSVFAKQGNICRVTPMFCFRREKMKSFRPSNGIVQTLSSSMMTVSIT